MASYPTLSENPDAEKWGEKPALNPTLKSKFENGKMLTRAKVTRVPRLWSFGYRLMSNADKILLQTFERDTVNYGADSFTWENPLDLQTYTVRFSKPLDFTYADTNAGDWNVDVELEEV